MRILPLILIMTLIGFTGCFVSNNATKAERRAERVEAQQQREQSKAYRQSVERHRKMQSSEVRKRMSQNRQRSERWIRSNRRPPFFVRWFERLTQRN